MRFREGISVGTKLDGRALPVSPRYFPRVQTSQFLGGLSHFGPIFVPRRQGFIDGLLTIYGRRPGHRAPACPGFCPPPARGDPLIPAPRLHPRGGQPRAPGTPASPHPRIRVLAAGHHPRVGS